MLTFVLSCAAGLVAYFSGEGAEDGVERLAGVSHAAVEAHEEAAKPAMIGMVALGLLSLAGLAASRRSDSRRLSLGILAGAAVLAGWNAYVGNLGGVIRHVEIAGGPAAVQADGPSVDVAEEDDD
jgi:hypothetical protein